MINSIVEILINLSKGLINKNDKSVETKSDPHIDAAKSSNLTEIINSLRIFTLQNNVWCQL